MTASAMRDLCQPLWRRRPGARSRSSPTMIPAIARRAISSGRRSCRGDHRFAARMPKADAGSIPVLKGGARRQCEGRQARRRRRACRSHAPSPAMRSPCRAAGARSSISPATRAPSPSGTRRSRLSCRPMSARPSRRRARRAGHEAVANALPTAPKQGSEPRERSRLHGQGHRRSSVQATKPIASRRSGGSSNRPARPSSITRTT